ncbi:MAG: hypothetical protein MJE66_17355 [Proteobacteria bacterium]|nr:hypothetical protein [Pseudomonadota bacterium]
MLVLGGLASLPAGWFGTDALERRNDFCNACHLREGVPLHIQIRRDFDAPEPASLAAAHAGHGVADGDANRAFRCIDCHGGVGLVGRARVKLLAARDTLVWLSGDFDEPDGMRHPLRDADCSQCHPSFAEKGGLFGAPAFHDLAVHNERLGVACVECHAAHEQGNVQANFLVAETVRAQCALCHAEFEEGR